VNVQNYRNEILEQPSVINKVPEQFYPEILKDLKNLKKKIDKKEIDKIIITGMGASLYGSYPLYLFLNKHIQIPISIWDCSELIQQTPNVITNKTIIIATSQSGESVELIKLTELKQQPKISISISNLPNNTLSNWSNISIFTNAGKEGTVSSKTYTGGCAAHHILGSTLIKKEKKAIIEIKTLSKKLKSFLNKLEKTTNKSCDFIEPSNALTFIGRGLSYSSAAYSALITAEASKLPSIGLSAGQFRHGPIEIVQKDFSCITFLGSKKNLDINKRLVKDIIKFGGKCLVITPSNNRIFNNKNLRIIKMPQINEDLLPILEVVPIQLMQLQLAKNRGFEAGIFKNANKVTSIE
tara:strand:+ start:514 stop:1572 length:1059 start_codon:yes stop_codon:yes gene_type:complete